jgi:septum formation protein
MELILASASPRRRELLDSLGLHYSVSPGAALDETAILAAASGELPARLEQLALAKGRRASAASPGAVVLSADTEVILDGACLGKPADAAEAQAMLARLAGREHIVCTALALQRAAPHLALTAHALTAVRFAALTPSHIAAYVQRVRPFDFAGGYAIQGLGSILIEGISGDYSNVVGLPLRLAAQLLEQAGYPLLAERAA